MHFAVLLSLIAHATFSFAAKHENICQQDDLTNDVPYFVDKRTICNFEVVPVFVYAVSILPNTDNTQFCLKGELEEAFNISKEKELKLFERVSLDNFEQRKTKLTLQIIKTDNKSVGVGAQNGRRRAINAIEFSLVIEDCNKISWQTTFVSVLSSLCIVLTSVNSIMLILYQQKRNSNGQTPNGDED